jgi:broad specificity phosphatase PhoE
MRRIYLARHGETEWNALGRLQGHTDVPLNDAGRAQARALGALLANERIASVTTSDLSRATETGALAVPGVPRSTDPDLRERRFGVFEGLTREECAVQHADDWRAWVERTAPPPGAEPVDLAVARMERALLVVVSAASLAANGAALVVSHGGIMRLWLTATSGSRVPMAPIGNGDVYLLEHDGHRFHVGAWEGD